MKLKKALDGLKQAPRAWNCRMNKDFQENGFLKCFYEHAHTMKDDGIWIVCLYVVILTGHFKSFQSFREQ